MIAIAAIILVGAVALVLPNDFVKPVLAVGVLAVPAFCILMMFLCFGKADAGRSSAAPGPVAGHRRSD